MAVLVTSAQAQIVLHGIGGATSSRGPTGQAKAHVGETVIIDARVQNLDTLDDDQRITNIVVEIQQAVPFLSPNLINSAQVGGIFVLANLNDFRDLPNLQTYVVQPNDPDTIVHIVHFDSHDLGNNLLQEADPRASLQVVRPCIECTKVCTADPVTRTISFTGTVRNCGNTPLSNVIIEDLVDGRIDPVMTIPVLDIGQTVTYSGSFTPADPCGTTTDTIRVRGTDELGLTITNTCSATCTLPPCQPDIEVTKEVACYLPGDLCGPFAKVATGVKDSECPAFCYRVTIINASPDVPIVSLTVTDPVLGGNISGLFGPLPIAPGDSRTAIIKPITHCEDTPDTVVAEGASAQGMTDVDQDSAEALVLDINIECESTLFSSMDMDGNPNDCNLELPEGFDGPVMYTLTLSNTGSSALNVTTLNGLPTLVDCGTGAPIVVPLPVRIPAGGTYTIQGCFNVVCGAPIQIRVTAEAEASDENGTLCVYDRNGNIITDESSPNDCVCLITCEQPTQCRVTGGGVLLPGTSDESCTLVETTIFPLQLRNGLPVKKITHGGQLGAPFSELDCGEVLGNPCIRGQWQHTRHYVGQANPRDVIDMNFHSVTPKGQFDSLLCACLGCCDPETGVFLNPITINGICNPDDHKICGPQPRPSPANAIIFSGVGRLKPETDEGANEKFAEWVIFRVYIEDRSEPGGFHPKGSVEPADIYCFQAWKTGIRTSRKPDFSTVSPDFRRALGEANCEFLRSLQAGEFPIGTLPSPIVDGATADIQDCGPMHDGNHQIHPATGATCND